MNTPYVPILKCKQGEQKALLQLEPSIKATTKPLLEIPCSEASKKRPLYELFQSFWNNYPFFFYFMPEWYEGDLERYSEFLTSNAKALINQIPGTPVIDLLSAEYIEEWKSLTKNGIAIRLRNNEFDQIAALLNPLFDSGKITRNQTDLIFDLQHISPNKLDDAKAILNTVFSNLPKAPEYHSIIVSSASFLKNTYKLDSSRVYRFERIEDKIHRSALKLSKQYKFHYLFSDYGTSDTEDFAYIPGISPNFKIKYTYQDKYLFIKGLQTKRKGLNIQNVNQLAKLLIKSPEFLGADFSWSDNCIYQIAEELSLSPGNLTTWVSYSMNHHITVISKDL